MSNPYNPYMATPNPGPYQPGYGMPNPYGQPMPQPQPAPSKPVFDFVNGVEGAKSYGVAPNRTAILMDTENAAVYIKTANGIGQATIEFYEIAKSSEEKILAQRKKAEMANFATREEFATLDSRLANIEKLLKAKDDKKDGEAK